MKPIGFGEALIFLGVLTVVGNYLALIHQWLKNSDKE